jgi:hypothetical protein
MPRPVTPSSLIFGNGIFRYRSDANIAPFAEP